MVFLDPENVEVLWEVILDENIAPATQEFRNVFVQGINAYYSQFGSSGEDLVQMNKRFISGFVYYEKQKRQPQPQQSQQSQPPSFQQQPVLAQDIMANRMSQFERDMISKQNEFNESMAQTIPEAPKFNDKMDEPIGSAMGDLIARTLTQRNLDIEQIHHSNAKKQDAEKWLSPEKTSLKPDVKKETPSPGFKYIKIGEEIPESEIDKPKIVKNLTWANDKEEKASSSIFSKLKTIHVPTLEEKVDDIIKLVNVLNDKINTLLSEKQEK
jgi:hypothetical protein